MIIRSLQLDYLFEVDRPTQIFLGQIINDIIKASMCTCMIAHSSSRPLQTSTLLTRLLSLYLSAKTLKRLSLMGSASIRIQGNPKASVSKCTTVIILLLCLFMWSLTTIVDVVSI